MIRLRVEPAALAEGDVAIAGDDHHYLTRVRRATAGDAVILFDGEGREADGVIAVIDGARAVVRAGAPRTSRAPAPRVVVLQALIKGERMDWCVEKLVEVGVDEVVLVTAERSVVRLDGERAVARQRRLQAVAEAAARQCGRGDVPAVTGPMDLAAAMAHVATCEIRLVCHPAAGAVPLAAGATGVAVLVGPEGGLSAAEVDAAVSAGFAPVALGPFILRAETAGPVAVAILRLPAPADR